MCYGVINMILILAISSKTSRKGTTLLFNISRIIKGYELGFLEWEEPTAVNLSPPLISSLWSLQPQPSTNQSNFLEGLSEGAKIGMILIRHFQNIACNASELTSFWLLLILGFIFVIAVIWGIMNINLTHHWEKEDWVKELTWKNLPC